MLIVLPMNELSDHSKIITFYTESLVEVNENDNDNYKWRGKGNLFKWDIEREALFYNKLRCSLKEIEEINQRINAGLIHSTGDLIQQLYINTAKATLKEKSKGPTKNWKRRKKSQKWFDEECESLKCQTGNSI